MNFKKNISSFLGLNLLSFFILLIIGKLSLELSSLDGYSTPVWPPAGIALALVLIVGKKIAFGIFLASFIINSNDFQGDILLYISNHYQNLIIAFGSSLQAIIGSILLNRLKLYPQLFYNHKDILLFYLYSGPISSLIASTIGAITLYLFNIIQSNFILNTWLIWWLGDSIGVIIFAPLILVIWNGIRKNENQMRVILVSIGMSLTLVFAGLIFIISRNWESKSLESRLQNDGNSISQSIQLILNENIRNTNILGTYILLTENIDRKKFEDFSRILVAQSNGLIALSWNPIILNKERYAAEFELKSGYSGYNWISERTPDGKLLKAATNPEYVYVKYIYPFEENKNALGFNVWSNPIRRSALKKSIENSKSELTGRILLVQEKEESYGVLLFTPIELNNRVIGFSTAVFRISTILEKAVSKSMQKNLCIQLEDELADTKEKVLFTLNCNEKTANSSLDLKFENSISVVSRKWRVKVIASKEYIKTYLDKSSSFVLVISFFLTGILGILILIITGRENSIQCIVQERTLELEKANQIKTDFLANMSHEIRTPMNGVLGMLQLLEDTPLNSEQKKYTSNATKSTKSLLSIINDILDVSKMEKGMLVLNPSAFDLSKLMNEMKDLFQGEVFKKGISLNIIYKLDNKDLYLLADENRLRQVLINIIGNSIKFTPEGKVELTLILEFAKKDIHESQILHFIISDTGIGISEEEIPFLFNQFVRVEDFKTKKFEGSGLGLYITKQLIELMGGEIYIESKLGEGTNIHFKIPYIPTLPIENENNVKLESKSQELINLHFLVAEDNEINQLYIGRILKKMGHTLDLAINGREAITFLDKNFKLYDLILMDIQMPELDGLSASKLIREENSEYKDIPIIALTANSMKFQIDEYLQVGINDYISKPIDSELLFKKIAKVLNIPIESIFRNKSKSKK